MNGRAGTDNHRVANDTRSEPLVQPMWMEGARFKGSQALIAGRSVRGTPGEDAEAVQRQVASTVEEARELVGRLQGTLTRLRALDPAACRLSRLFAPRPLYARPVEPVADAAADVETPDKFAQLELSLKGCVEGLHDAMDQESLNRQVDIIYAVEETINQRLAELDLRFRGLVQDSAFSPDHVAGMVSRIGHSDYRAEAATYCTGIDRLAAGIHVDRWSSADFNILSQDAVRALGLMNTIGNYRDAVEQLVLRDRVRRRRTLMQVVAYIGLAALAIAMIVVAFTVLGPVSPEAPLEASLMPPLFVPWQVLLWSLIGSFAAMIHRLNRNPIYDRGDAFRWMVTRPIQGVVLGAATYLMLATGLFLILDPTSVEGPSGDLIMDEVVLLISFLVGFSDRFANSVLNTLVRQYTPGRDVTSSEEERQ